LVVVDVGHGNAAVLKDTDGCVVFDTGKKGPGLLAFLEKNGISEISALVLSHADDDHIGNASVLLLDKQIQVARVYFNSDPTKGTDSQRQFMLAVRTARREKNTEAHPALSTTSTGQLDCGAVHIEVLYPPPEELVTGIGGLALSGRRSSSNSLSAAIRLCHVDKPCVLLGGDVGRECLRFWSSENVSVRASVLVFPHHGGSPESENAATFAHGISTVVAPSIVIFSIHRTRFDLPRNDVVRAILKALPKAKLMCTQLHDVLVGELRKKVKGPWSLHRIKQKGKETYWQGSICIELAKGIARVGPHRPPRRPRSPRRR